MKRFVNIRLPVIVACTLALGIFTGYLFSFYHIDLIWLTATVPVTAIFLITFSLLRRKKFLIFTAIAIAVFFSGFLNSFVRLENYRLTDIETSVSYQVSGTVIEKIETDYGEYVILDNVRANGIKLSGKVYVNLSKTYGEFCDVGYKVEFFSILSLNDLYPYGKLNYRTQDNVKYSCTVTDGLKSEYGFSLFGCIRSRIRNVFYENLDRHTASICYAMVIGDTSGVDSETLDSFRYGGVAHIFAVSGLHIGIIFGIISFVFNKMRANKYVSCIVCLGLIIFYSGICGFTVSSIRAVIMCAVTMLTKLFHVKRDGLNSLAFAVLLILLIFPLNLFSIGFQLSVCAVGGILLFSVKISKLLQKLKLPKKFCSNVGTTFGATAGTLPAMMAGFGYVSGAGILLNIIIIPVISLLFEFVFISTILATIIPQLGVILQYVVLPLQAVLSFILSKGFENALISGFGAGWFAILYNFALLILSDKFNLKILPRSIAFSISAIAITAYVLMQTFPPVDGFKITVSSSSYGGCVLFKSSQGNILVITENYSVTQVIGTLNENYSLNLSGIVMLGGEKCAEKYDKSLNCNTVYLSADYLPVQPFRDVDFRYEYEFCAGGINFQFIDGKTLFAECDGIKVCICEGKNIPATECDLLVSHYSNFDSENNVNYCNAENTAYFNLKYTIYNVYEYGNLQYKVTNGALFFTPPIKH